MFNFFRKKYKISHARDEKIVDIIKPNIENGPWIAGGAVLQWLNQKPVKHHDIDIFVKDSQQLEAVHKALTDRNFIVNYDTDNAVSYISYEIDMNYKVQIVKYMFSSAEECIKNFDFTVCAVATDGNVLVKVPEFDEDFRTKTLKLQNKVRNDVLKRAVKYMVYGYNPDDSFLDQVYSTPELTNSFSDLDQYDLQIR